MKLSRNLLSRDLVRGKAKKLGWVEAKPTYKRLKGGVVTKWTWKISNKKKLVVERIGHTRGGSRIYYLAKKEQDGQRVRKQN